MPSSTDDMRNVTLQLSSYGTADYTGTWNRQR